MPCDHQATGPGACIRWMIETTVLAGTMAVRGECSAAFTIRILDRWSQASRHAAILIMSGASTVIGYQKQRDMH
jgi:hypothetical protein